MNTAPENDKYSRILSLPRHISNTRAGLSTESRAAQFAPFAALKGFENETEQAQNAAAEAWETENGEILPPEL